MAVASTRLDELRRRVERDPASLAFAALAEECRRQGQLEEAIAVCRAGLERHPDYVSARVTLGRALLDRGDQEAARTEFEQVIRLAPENLAAIRGLAEICRRPAEGLGAASPASPGAVLAASTPVAPAAPAPAQPLPTASADAEAGLQKFLDDIRRTRAELGR